MVWSCVLSAKYSENTGVHGTCLLYTSASGLRILVDSRVDYGRSRNLMLTSIVFVTGLSGISVNIGTVSLTGMVLACVVAMALSLIFYILDKLKLTNDREV